MSYPSPFSLPGFEPSGHIPSPQNSFHRLIQLIDEGLFEDASLVIQQLPIDALSRDDAIVARVIGMQLNLEKNNYFEVMRHADAALDLTEMEPLIYNLMGQALWCSGNQRGGAEALVRAAELFRDGEFEDQPLRLPIDAASIYFMAGEACKAYEQHESSLAFFELALLYAPEHEDILREISEIKATLGMTRRVA